MRTPVVSRACHVCLCVVPSKAEMAKEKRITTVKKRPSA